jgi:uncharacterized membrane protein YidH (DUF202 family)
MKRFNSNRGLFRFLGITLFVQAVTSLIGGSIFLGPFDSSEITDLTLRSINDSTGIAYTSILLQIITGVIIIMLGVAMYRAAGHINKTMGIIALSLYIFEATLLVVGQVFVFGLVEVSHLYIISSEANLLTLGKVLFACREFAGQIAMIPFGIGAMLFYYLMLKSKIIPKWLALWGILTVPFIMISTPLIAFGIPAPIFLFIPYVPFEFFTGIYIIVKYRKN